MSSPASAMNLNRFSTYDLACDLKDQIQELEGNWDADVQRLERAKRTRVEMQERVHILQMLLDEERVVTESMERKLQATTLELEIPNMDSSVDDPYESSSFSSTSIYSDSDFCLVYNSSAARNIRTVDKPSARSSVAEEQLFDAESTLSVSDTVTQPTRSAQWKQLIASFLPNSTSQRSLRSSPDTVPPSMLSAITSSDLNIDHPKRHLVAQTSSLKTIGGLRSTAMNDWRNSAEAAGGRYTRRKTRCKTSEVE